MTSHKPSMHDVSEAREIARQAEVELKMLLIVEQSLRVALQWMTGESRNSHKLSTLRFHVSTFERHLSRLQILADHGGYLHVITDARPHLAADVEALRNDRAVLHKELTEIILRLDEISPDDGDGFSRACTDLARSLDHLRVQAQKEIELHQHAFTQEEGGSG